MSADPVYSILDWSHAELSERVVHLALAGDTHSFEWQWLDQEVQRRLAENYADASCATGPVGRFRPILVVNVE